MIIAFDVDGTLISNKDDSPRLEIIELLKVLSHDNNNHIVVWSGGGQDYAEMWCNRLGIMSFVSEVIAKDYRLFDKIDMCFDDETVKLARTNIRV